MRLALLVLLSFAFYGWWDLRLLPLLVFSVAINWLAGVVFVRTRSRFIVPLAIGLDLLLLALTGIGPLIAWRKASTANLRRHTPQP